ncbi:D-2-hydroxyacid dehydrogenase family protein [Pseudonocardia sp. WMMC193]|uniref:D-2-hydroxyacid dehydrogenase family protein n=1 Tax=Pseudonocardia sp. WMMC193 TaxID=2911965 RepID=UPI001F1874DA|nr:D-2-hydroxyacid dehydrogenase family protein [Pseudonocardia sp. WMMC193]MCF7550616.1 D-2-hydroxyacid dehydrogenase family protein [Pseudonocardia sp. WMMC193]
MTAFRVALLDDYQQVAVALLALPPDVEPVAFGDHVDDEDQLVARLRDVDAIVCMRERTPITAGLLARLPRLRLVVTAGMRNAAIDIAAAAARGVTVCGTTSTSTSTTEHTWALLLALARNVPAQDAAVRAGGWQLGLAHTLSGATLGLLGLGRLGAAMVPVARAFGMDVVAWSPNLTAERAAEVGVRAVGRDELFATADVLSVHLVLSPRSAGTVGAAELARMKPTALLVNTSRGPIVDERALVDALREGRIAGAALDVFDREPLPADHPLRTAPRTVLTPHTGYVSARSLRDYFTAVGEIVAAFRRGEPVGVLQP